VTWETTLQRQLAAPVPPIEVPIPLPSPTEASSWLTYDDPKGRFHFRHPQELILPVELISENGDVIQLVDTKAGADEGRVVTLSYLPPTGKPETDRANRDPETWKKELEESWAKNRNDVLRGAAKWLPDADWQPYKMKVYRIEAALRAGGGAGREAPRIFLDRYVVVFSQNATLLVDAMTGQDPPHPFRKMVEDLLKTFQPGPSAKPRG
jgi:hypothetical protein